METLSEAETHRTDRPRGRRVLAVVIVALGGFVGAGLGVWYSGTHPCWSDAMCTLLPPPTGPSRLGVCAPDPCFSFWMDNGATIVGAAMGSVGASLAFALWHRRLRIS